MPTFATPAQHIVIGDKGVPQILGTRMKVSQVAIDHTRHGLTPELIVERYPDILTLAQVYAALAYYEDNTAAIEQQIAEEQEYVEAMRAQHPQSPMRA